jgi:subtilisin family serine protease
MPLRVRTVRNTSSGIAEIINAIDYAVLNGASIINASFGSPDSSQAEEDAIERARGKNVLFIAAAGNEGNDTDDYPMYPADYPIDNIISVLSTDPTDHKGYQSCYGYETVDSGAPGEPI